MFNSIKLKLLIWFLVVFSLFFTGLEIFLYYKLEALVISLADEHLKSEIQTLANLMAVEDEQGQLEKELAEIAVATTGAYSEKLSGHYYQIVDADGTVLVQSPSLFLAEESLPVVKSTFKPEYMTIEGPEGAPLRLITQSFKFSLGTLTFQAGDSLVDTYRLLSSFRHIILVVFPAIFILCGLGIYIFMGLALRSLKSFTAKVGQITEENLSERLEERGVVTELKPLAIRLVADTGTER